MQAADRLRELGLTLSPTFMAFTPWTTTSTYLEMLSVIGELNLIDHVAPIQYAIRLLIPPGSRLMELREIQDIVEPYDHSALYYPWQNPDPKSINYMSASIALYIRIKKMANRDRFSLQISGKRYWIPIQPLNPHSQKRIFGT